MEIKGQMRCGVLFGFLVVTGLGRLSISCRTLKPSHAYGWRASWLAGGVTAVGVGSSACIGVRLIRLHDEDLLERTNLAMT